MLYPNLPLDLIEALTYGREWQLGHDKLPPLPWWMVEIVYRLIGRDIVYLLLAQVACSPAFALRLGEALPIVGATGALVVDPDHRRHSFLQFHRRRNSITT